MKGYRDKRAATDSEDDGPARKNRKRLMEEKSKKKRRNFDNALKSKNLDVDRLLEYEDE